MQLFYSLLGLFSKINKERNIKKDGIIQYKLRTYEQYLSFHKHTSNELEVHMKSLETISKTNSSNFLIPGYSYKADKQLGFLINRNKDGVINWRESVNCLSTGFNNRMRATIHFFDSEMEAYSDSKIYITEQVTPMFDYFNKNFTSVVGSEYLDDTFELGGKNKKGIRNENLCSLSFPSETFDIIISLDVLEHIPNYHDAFNECERVLKSGGKMIWSVPFIPNMSENLIRAKMEGKKIHHILPPEFHGDPLTTDGVLCFQYFGWEMLEYVRSIGFKDAYAICYYSTEFGYLGGEQFIFVAIKE